jgi:hypothetical protein
MRVANVETVRGDRVVEGQPSAFLPRLVEGFVTERGAQIGQLRQRLGGPLAAVDAADARGV